MMDGMGEGWRVVRRLIRRMRLRSIFGCDGGDSRWTTRGRDVQ